MTVKTVPCVTCPWRKSSTVGGTDIPGFSLCKMQGLTNTVGHGDAFRVIMACHYSEEGEEEPCIGYVAQEGWSNLSIRMMVIRGDLDMAAIMDACADLELWSDFDTMLEAYEEAADG